MFVMVALDRSSIVTIASKAPVPVVMFVNLYFEPALSELPLTRVLPVKEVTGEEPVHTSKPDTVH